MKKESVLLLAICLAAIAPCHSQGLEVYRSEADTRLASRMLFEYLTAEAHDTLRQRAAQVETITTPRQVQERQKEIRQKILSMLGPLPEKTPLEAETTGSFTRDGYKVEKVVFQSRPHYYVTANLYLPEGQGPFPGILGPCGHSLNGKAAGVYQMVYSGLARLGCVVLVYDQPGQGERFMYYDEDLGESVFHPRWPSTVEHTMAGIQCLLTGSSAATHFVWDGIRAIDYLVSRPEVDPSRIGVTGNSGGGTMSAYLSALDERIQVAVPSCYMTSWQMLWDTIGPQDAEQNLLPFIANNLDFPDYAIAFAPKPYLINAAIQDFFPIRGTRATFREVQRIYEVMGAGDKVELFEADDGHGYTKPRREAAYRWFGTHLLNRSGPWDERPMTPELDFTLQVTPTGQVVTTYEDAESMSGLNAAYAKVIAPESPELTDPQQVQDFRAGLLTNIRELLAYREVAQPLNVQNRGNSHFQGMSLEYLTFDSEPGITLPALLFRPTESAAQECPVLYVSHRNKSDDAAADIADLVGAGHPVLAPDLRGQGETARPDSDGGSFATWFSPDYRIAMMALHLRRPLVGMRTLDLVRATDLIKQLYPDQELIAVGKGSGTVPLLHAAALDQRLDIVVLEGGLISWRHMVANPYHRQQLDNVVLGALTTYDLPLLGAIITPRTLVLGNMVDAVGHLILKDAVAQEYGTAREAYQSLGVSDRLLFVNRQPGVSFTETYGDLLKDR